MYLRFFCLLSNLIFQFQHNAAKSAIRFGYYDQTAKRHPFLDAFGYLFTAFGCLYSVLSREHKFELGLCFLEMERRDRGGPLAGTEKTAAPKGGRLRRDGMCWGQALSAAAAAAVVVAAAAIAAPAAAAAAADQQNEDDDPAAVPAEEAVITHTGTSYGVVGRGTGPTS